MAAPVKNEFWKLRLKHGRDKAISSPDELWDNFVEYAQWCEDNPLYETDFKGASAKEVNIPKMRAMTKDSFALACGLCGWETINNYKNLKDFSEVVTRIENYIYTQKLQGSAAGLLNPSIIASELGLKSHQEVNSTIKNINVSPKEWV